LMTFRSARGDTVGNYKILEKFCIMTNLALGPTYKKPRKIQNFLMLVYL